MFKKIISILLALAIPFCVVGCNKQPEDPNKNDNQDTITPTLSVTEIDLKVDQSYTLTVLDYDGVVEWGVSDTNVINVDNGVVTAVGIGTANVTAIVGDIVLTCKVECTVDYVAVPNVVLDGEVKGDNGYVITLQVNSSYEITPKLIISGVAIEDITFTVSCQDDSLTIEKYTVKALLETTGSNVTFSCEYQGQTYSVVLTVVVL